MLIWYWKQHRITRKTQQIPTTPRSKNTKKWSLAWVWVRRWILLLLVGLIPMKTQCGGWETPQDICLKMSIIFAKGKETFLAGGAALCFPRHEHIEYDEGWSSKQASKQLQIKHSWPHWSLCPTHHRKKIIPESPYWATVPMQVS